MDKHEDGYRLQMVIDYRWTNRWMVIQYVFFSFGILYDDITPKVLKIFRFCKKFLKDMGNAFYDVKLIEIFY